MVKHITHLLTPGGSSAAEVKANEDAVFEQIRGSFALIVFSCVQLASKLSLHSHVRQETIYILSHTFKTRPNHLISLPDRRHQQGRPLSALDRSRRLQTGHSGIGADGAEGAPIPTGPAQPSHLCGNTSGGAG